MFPNQTKSRMMPRLLIACGLLATAPNAEAQFTAGQVPISGASDPAFATLDSQITQHMATNQISAMTVAVMNGSRVMYERGFGWQDYTNGDLTPIAENDVMRVASVTKPLIAAAVQKLIADGVINASDKVFDYGQATPGTGILPADVYYPYNDTLGDARLIDISVRNVLRHRGGWDSTVTQDPQFDAVNIATTVGGIDSPPGPVYTVRYMLAQPLDYTPGTNSGLCDTEYCYSNFGYMLLALIIDEVTGQDHLDYIHDNFTATWGSAPSELQHGRTFEVDQDPREPYYYTSSANWTNVFDPSGPLVYGPYGGWEQEVFIGHGDLVTNAVTMLRFLDRYLVYNDYWNFINPSGFSEIGSPLSSLPGWTGWFAHSGSLPGTNAWARQDGTSGMRIAIIANRRKSSSDDQYVEDVADDINALVYGGSFVWPTRYATDNWVDFSLGASGDGTFENPMKDLNDVYPIVQTGGRIKIKPGATNWTGTINQAVKLDAPLGTVFIGQQ